MSIVQLQFKQIKAFWVVVTFLMGIKKNTEIFFWQELQRLKDKSCPEI